MRLQVAAASSTTQVTGAAPTAEIAIPDTSAGRPAVRVLVTTDQPVAIQPERKRTAAELDPEDPAYNPYPLAADMARILPGSPLVLRMVGHDDHILWLTHVTGTTCDVTVTPLE